MTSKSSYTPATAAERERSEQAATRRKRIGLLIVLPLLALLAIAVIYLKGGRYVETDNGYVKADKVQVSAEVSGRIQSVAVRENERVQAGQLLFSIDEGAFLVKLRRAEAGVAQVRTDLAAIKASYREKQAEIGLARTQFEFARKAEKRQADLAEKRYVSASMYDDAKENVGLAEQRISVQERDLARIAESLGGTVGTPVEQHPAFLSAMAELEQARLDLARTRVRAPADGTVTKPPKVGQFADIGKTTMMLVADSELWVEANFTETDLTYVHPGQRVSVKIDTYPDQVWQGIVDSISPATGAEFSVIPAQNATGNWVKITQRVPVRIRIDKKPSQPLLRAGLSADVSIDTGHRRHLPGLAP